MSEPGDGRDTSSGNGRAEAPGPEEQKRLRDDAALRERLSKLSSALDTQRREAQERKSAHSADMPGGETGKALSLGLRVLSEFVAGIIAGGAIGWLLDKWFSTSPVFLLIFGVLGTITGFWNVYRIAARPTVGRDGSSGKKE